MLICVFGDASGVPGAGESVSRAPGVDAPDASVVPGATAIVPAATKAASTLADSPPVCTHVLIAVL